MTPEKRIQNDILRRFGADPRLRLWRQNTGVARYAAPGGPRTVRFGLPGAADLSGILRDGRRIEIEVKAPTGRQTEEQQRFGAMIERMGGIYVLARSVEDVEARLKDL